MGVAEGHISQPQVEKQNFHGKNITTKRKSSLFSFFWIELNNFGYCLGSSQIYLHKLKQCVSNSSVYNYYISQTYFINII